MVTISGFSLAARKLCVSQFKSSKVESACLCDRSEREVEGEGEGERSLYSILPEASRAGLSASTWVRPAAQAKEQEAEEEGERGKGKLYKSIGSAVN